MDKYCFSCRKEFPIEDVVMTAACNWDGTGRYMCKKCYGRGRESLGGWKGLVDGDTATMNHARAIMWRDVTWHAKPE